MEQPPYDNEQTQPTGSMPFYQSAQPEAGAVWPPPIIDQSGIHQSIIVPWRVLYRRIGKAKISDIREGLAQFSAAGIELNGKAMPRQEISQPIIITAFFLLRGIGALIAWAILRYGCAQPANFLVPWADVTQVVLNSKRSEAGFSYNGLNYRGKPMEFSVCGKMRPDEFAAFSTEVRRYAPERTMEGRLRSATTPLTWLVCILLVGGFFAFLAWASFGHH